MSNSSSITVLLIDSHAEDRQYWLQRLNISTQAYRVLEAETGAAGLEMCRTEHVDCMVTERTCRICPGLKCSFISFLVQPTQKSLS